MQSGFCIFALTSHRSRAHTISRRSRCRVLRASSSFELEVYAREPADGYTTIVPFLSTLRGSCSRARLVPTLVMQPLSMQRVSLHDLSICRTVLNPERSWQRSWAPPSPENRGVQCAATHRRCSCLPNPNRGCTGIAWMQCRREPACRSAITRIFSAPFGCAALHSPHHEAHPLRCLPRSRALILERLPAL